MQTSRPSDDEYFDDPKKGTTYVTLNGAAQLAGCSRQNAKLESKKRPPPDGLICRGDRVTGRPIKWVVLIDDVEELAPEGHQLVRAPASAVAGEPEEARSSVTSLQERKLRLEVEALTEENRRLRREVDALGPLVEQQWRTIQVLRGREEGNGSA